MNDKDQKIKIFKIFGMTIEFFSFLYGLFLILWGIIISYISLSNSFTSYIPSILGIPILVFSLLSIKFIKQKKMLMHIVVFFGFIILLGGFDFFRSIINGNLFNNLWGDISKLMMLLSGLFFVYQCIRSFIHARKLRETDNI
tara:strand:+ start:153 stop:578 length:426 start_codon:yes stop_codon:yes gene_type:complete